MFNHQPHHRGLTGTRKKPISFSPAKKMASPDSCRTRARWTESVRPAAEAASPRVTNTRESPSENATVAGNSHLPREPSRGALAVAKKRYTKAMPSEIVATLNARDLPCHNPINHSFSFTVSSFIAPP